jgi:hypothetical protein
MDRIRTAAQATFIIAVFSLIFGTLALADFGQIEDNTFWGLYLLVLAAVFAVLGYFVWKGSLLALVVALTIYLGDSGLWLTRLIQNEARLPLAWATFRAAMIVFMARGVLSKLQSKLPRQSRVLNMVRTWGKGREKRTQLEWRRVPCFPLVPKLLFGNARFSKLRFGQAAWSGETEFRKPSVPKQEFGNEVNRTGCQGPRKGHSGLPKAMVRSRSFGGRSPFPASRSRGQHPVRQAADQLPPQSHSATLPTE